ncbi:MAG TPA: hypothetical protein VHB21_14210, partial [Minicystis sp.]|nr:hypothetical protein [Minicystis sp.]
MRGPARQRFSSGDSGLISGKCAGRRFGDAECAFSIVGQGDYTRDGMSGSDRPSGGDERRTSERYLACFPASLDPDDAGEGPLALIRDLSVT